MPEGPQGQLPCYLLTTLTGLDFVRRKIVEDKELGLDRQVRKDVPARQQHV